MKDLGISGAEVCGVFDRGEHGVTPNSKMAVRKYNDSQL